MELESVLEQIADNPKLPSPPPLTLRVLEQASRPNGSLGEIGKTLSLDPGLCGKMLKLVNSSLFGLHRPVNSIERALQLLGLNHVRSLVLSLSLPSLRFKNASNKQVKAYWKSSVTVAMVCRELAERRRWSDPDSEMVAGLLCDMGIMLLQETFPEKYARVLAFQEQGAGVNLCALEEREVAVNHADVGAHVLRRWKLGEELTEAIRFHHRPDDAPPAHRDRALLLFFGSEIASLDQTKDQALLLGQIVAMAQECYGLQDEQFFAFLDTLEAKISEFAALLELKLAPSESITNLFARATENLTRLAVEASLDNVRVHQEFDQVEQRLRQATESLEKSEVQLRQAQKMEAIGRLAGGLAHDFNNLLTLILGNCDLLLDRKVLDPEGRTLVEEIVQTGARGADLTRQLLAFSRQQVLSPEILCLNNTIANLSNILRRLLGSHIIMDVRLAEDLEFVKIDSSQIQQVILNLAINARDAMSKGGTLTIETFNLELGEEVTARNPDIRPGHYVVLTVRDTGCGMKDEIMRQIFEPFFTTKDAGKGTGLGLATVHGIVCQSGGHITVSSEVGKGSVFHIYLPATAAPLAGAAGTPSVLARASASAAPTAAGSL